MAMPVIKKVVTTAFMIQPAVVTISEEKKFKSPFSFADILPSDAHDKYGYMKISETCNRAATYDDADIRQPVRIAADNDTENPEANPGGAG